VRKIAQGFAAAVATMLLVALLAGFPAPQALAAGAFAPDCKTDITGQTDCGGSDFFQLLFIAIGIFVVVVIIGAVIGGRRK
jgi:hypothetical protein